MCVTGAGKKVSLLTGAFWYISFDFGEILRRQDI